MCENSHKLCDRIKLILLQKQLENDTNKTDDENKAIIDKLLEYQSITKTHRKRFLQNFILYKCIISSKKK